MNRITAAWEAKHPEALILFILFILFILSSCCRCRCRTHPRP